MTNVRLLVGGLTLWAAFSFTATVAAAAERVPFTSVDDGLIQIHASLDGGRPVPMLVDLGAGIDILATDEAKRLAVTTDSRYVGWRMEGERVDLPMGAVPSISLGGFTIDKADVGVWNGFDGSGFAGLISATAFRRSPVTFDFTNHELIIEDAATLAGRKRTGTRIPIALQDDRGISLGIFARFDFGNGQSGLCEIDTGSQGFILDKRFSAKLGIDLSDPKLKHQKHGSGERIAATIPSIALSGAPATAIAHPTALFADLIYDCNVGNDFWTGRRFTLDIPERTLYV